MLLQDIFKKPVNRPIEGVIKANDESSLRTEIEEYVITNEISREISKFFNEYLNYTNANGVWMSGFFGSGKSHLLKMLALLLENRQVDGQSTLEMFLTKTTDDAILSGNMKNVCKIPAKSILFNIALKANVINQDKDDALVSVFVKVFNEMCGYFGNQPEIAQFERDLTAVGSMKRSRVLTRMCQGKNGKKVVSRLLSRRRTLPSIWTGRWRPKGRRRHPRSLPQHEVRHRRFRHYGEGVHRQAEKGFRLVFFVDEVGQFIAENVNLMLSLQTIAEGLATKCRGQAWVVVTSQEDLGRILGDMNKSKANDFSRIQARFSNRINSPVPTLMR
jgi:energy-coupling factor transporter ATP-binding protein EcfA2